MAEIRIQEWHKHKIYQLSNGNLTAYINPEDGMNVFKLCHDETEIVSYQEERAKSGAAYGIPILFPTPNRTKDGIFTFEGQSYAAKMHGIARKACFKIEEAAANASKATIMGSLMIQKDTVFYTEFPFVCALTVQITLTKEGLQYHYEVENQDEKRLPFGFALHPFFNKINDETKVWLWAESVMLKNEDYIPNGQTQLVKGTVYDLTKEKKVSELALDDVYMTLSERPSAILTFEGFQVIMESSEDFTHIVVYTPKNQAFFCVEPQTCATDAINLYERGEKEVSGLIVLEPGERSCGEVTFKIKNTH